MSRSEKSAIVLLKSDHREVEQLFKQFDDAEGNSAKQASLASQIGQALTIHAELEETFLYPRVFALAKNKDEEQNLVCEATVEHGTLRGLIADMNGKNPSDPMVKAHVVVLKEYVEHHVKEEEREFFPRVEAMDIDLDLVGEEMANAKLALQREAGATATGSTICIVDVKVNPPRRKAA